MQFTKLAVAFQQLFGSLAAESPGGRDYLLSRLRSSKRPLKQLDSCIVARRSPCRLLSLRDPDKRVVRATH
jgi:hypothetical protein